MQVVVYIPDHIITFVKGLIAILVMAAAASVSLGLAIWKYVPPVVAGVGTIGNIVVLLVMTNRHTKKSSFTTYLAALAVVDTLILHVALCQTWFPIAFSVDVFTYSDVSCKIFRLALYLLPALGAWILVLISMERVFCIRRPQMVKPWCTPKVAVFAIFVTFIILFGVDSHMIYGLEVRSFNYTNYTLCNAAYDESYEDFFLMYWNWIDLGVAFLLPAAVILSTNTVTVITVFRSSANFTTVMTSMTARRNKALLLITISISLAFITLVSPLMVWLQLSRYNSSSWRMEEDVFAAVAVNLYMLNSAINFLLYVFSGRRFRQNLKQALCG